MRSIENTLDNIHRRTVEMSPLRLFTAILRPLLGLAFIPPSIPKIMHQPFTILDDSNPVGAYFGALYRTGFYYDFLGWSQLTAAILLLIPRTSHLGALLFFPIILNIAVLTTSVGFKGTWLITILMSLAALYLVCWDYPRWKSILFSRSESPARPSNKILLATVAFFATVPTIFIFTLASILGTIKVLPYRVIGVMALMGFLFGIFVTLQYRFMTVTKAESS